MSINPTAYYEQLTASRIETAFDVGASEAAFASLCESQPIVEILTSKKKSFFLRRDVDFSGGSSKAYRVFAAEPSARAGDGEIGSCHLRGPLGGIATIIRAAVNEAFQRNGIASAVYDRIVSDMESVGATLWPASPATMTDAEFKIWWRRAPVLVFYYPHRKRLGLEARPEYEALLSESLSMGVGPHAVSGTHNSDDAWSKFGAAALRWLRPTRSGNGRNSS